MKKYLLLIIALLSVISSEASRRRVTTTSQLGQLFCNNFINYSAYYTAYLSTVAAAVNGSDLDITNNPKIGAGSVKNGGGRNTFVMADVSNGAGAGKIVFYSSVNTVVKTSSSALTFSAGDELRLVVTRNDATFSATFYNLTTVTNITDSYTFTLNSGSDYPPGSGDFSMVFASDGLQEIHYSLYGQTGLDQWVQTIDFQCVTKATAGAQKIHSHKCTSTSYKNPYTLFIGNSVTYGLQQAATTASAYPKILAAYSTVTIVNNSGGGDQIADLLAKIGELRKIRPRNIAIQLGENDVIQSISSGVYEPKYTSSVSSLKSRGVKVTHLWCTPFGAGNATSVNTFKSTFSSDVVISSYWDKMRSGTGLDATYQADANHPNVAGHALVGATLALECTHLYVSTYHKNAIAYFMAVVSKGVTPSSGDKTAFSTFFSDAESSGWWTSEIAVYPMYGGTSATNAIDAKYPGQLSKELVYTGSLTHGANGITGAGGKAATWVSPNNVTTVNHTDMTIYIGTNDASTTVDASAFQSSVITFEIQSRRVGDASLFYCYDGTSGAGSSSTTGNTDSRGCYILSRESSASAFYMKNGTVIGSITGTSGTIPSSVLFTFLARPDGSAPSIRQLRYGDFGTGISSSLATTKMGHINTLQTALSGRNTY